MKQQILELIKQLEELRESSYLRSKMFYSNGVQFPDEYRAKSAGYADVYSFCILRLRDIVDLS